MKETFDARKIHKKSLTSIISHRIGISLLSTTHRNHFVRIAIGTDEYGRKLKEIFHPDLVRYFTLYQLKQDFEILFTSNIKVTGKVNCDSLRSKYNICYCQ